MEEKTAGLFVIFAVSLPCILMGYFIAVKQKRDLIAGWNASKVSNPEAFAKLVGYSVLLVGVLLLIIGIAWYLGIIGTSGMSIAAVIVSLMPLPFVVIAHIKYGKKE